MWLYSRYSYLAEGDKEKAHDAFTEAVTQYDGAVLVAPPLASGAIHAKRAKAYQVRVCVCVCVCACVWLTEHTLVEKVYLRRIKEDPCRYH